MKKNEMKQLGNDKLQSNLLDLKKELIRLNAQISTHTNPENPGNVRKIKKNIARILTFMKQNNTQPIMEKEENSKEDKKKRNE